MNDLPHELRREPPSEVRRRTQAAETWKVLAHVPRLDAAVNATANATLHTANQPGVDGRHEGQIDNDPGRADIDDTVAGPTARPSNHGLYVDGPHAIRTSSEPDAADSIRAREAIPVATGLGREALGDEHDLPIDADEDEADFASRIYRLHALAAPYAGVIVAVALVLSAGLLYWLTLSPPRRTVDYDEPSVPSLDSWNVSVDANEATTLSENSSAVVTEAPGREHSGGSAPAWATGTATPVYQQTPFDEQPSIASATLPSDTPLRASPPANAPRPAEHAAEPEPDAREPIVESGGMIAQKFESTGSAELDFSRMFPAETVGAETVQRTPLADPAAEARLAERPPATAPAATSNR